MTFQHLYQRRRLIFAMTLLLVLVGFAAFMTMARQEDPSFPYRPGLIEVVYPGATAAQVEKLILEPLEEELQQVEELYLMRSVARDDIAMIQLRLADQIYDTDAAWDRVRRAMERARGQFPAGVTRLQLDDRAMDIPVAVVSVLGSNDPIELADAADQIKQRLLGVAGISRVQIRGAPAKEVVIDIDSATLHQLGLRRQQLAAQLQRRNLLTPGGLLNNGERFIRLHAHSDIESLDDIRTLPVKLPSGQQVALETIASVRLEPQLPLAAQSFHKGVRAVTLGIIAERGHLDTLAFSDVLQQQLDQLQPMVAPLRLEVAFWQPDYVRARLSELQGSLLLSTGIIAAIVLLALGWGNGLLVALVLPIVSLITLAVYNLFGGVLHQIAVIGVVVSLGILIDNAIVMVESIEAAKARGLARAEAIGAAVRQLAMPLFTSTGTTVAAFLPLLISKGNTADFTRAIPEMVVIAMIVSYCVSVLVLPLVAYYWPARGTPRSVPGTAALARGLQVMHARYRVLPLLVVVFMVAAALALGPLVKKEFFPPAYRNQIVVDVNFPVGTPVDFTAQASADLEAELQQHPAVEAIMRSVGMTGFRYFYNLTNEPAASHLARLMVYTRDPAANPALITWIEQELRPRWPEALIIAKTLGQGPPIPAPIEVRLQSHDSDALFVANQQVLAALHELPGSRNVRSNLDTGIPELTLRISDTSTQSLGLEREAFSAELFAQTRGLVAGEFRYSNNPVPIRVRSRAGERTPLEAIPGLTLYQDSLQGVPLDAVSVTGAVWTAAEIHHYNGIPTVSIYSDLQPGAAFNRVLASLSERLAEQPLPAGVTLSYGGNAEESGSANRAILTSAPLGIGLLLLFMMIQFNSFRRLGIILTTIPLAGVGILPGLVLTDQPFSFMSLLGVIALVGIVVNNAIVLLDVIDSHLAAGADATTAVAAALEQRTAPILLTTATTILGLLPLALTDSTLWPPLAWAVISGLTLSTMLTLVAIPALCQWLLKSDQATVAAKPNTIPV